MSKAFDTITIHTLIRKLLQTNIPDTIMKFIENYIKGYKLYTTYRNHTSIQPQFKTDVLQGGVLSPTVTFTLQIYSCMTQTYNICMMNTHTSHKSTCSSMPHISNRNHTIHHFPYRNIQHISPLQGLKLSIFNNVCYTTNIPADTYNVTTTDIKKQACTIYTHLLSLGI